MLRNLRILGVFGVFVAVSWGCGGSKSSSKIECTGKLILPAGLTLADQDMVMLHFDPEDGKGTTAGAKVNVPDMSFSVKGNDQKGGPLPGKYKVSVQITPYSRGGGDKAQGKAQQFLTKLNSTYGIGKSPLTYEVTNDPKQTMTVDLEKGTITK